MSTLYNDNDPFVCQWLRNLVEAGELPHGDVTETPIQELDAHEIPDTFHTFAGISGWPFALRLAGWPDDRPVWTGSCPCQPFSSAGKGRGTEDERHLWPVFRDLIEVGKPATVFGEQVASPAGRDWLAGVRADLEALGYEVGAADLCAASVGAPHIRQRLFWVANREGCDREVSVRGRRQVEDRLESRGGSGACDGVADSESERLNRVEGSAGSNGGRGSEDSGGMGNAVSKRLERHARHVHDRHQPGWLNTQSRGSTAETSGIGLVLCREPNGTERIRRCPTEPELFPLAHGVPNRVGRLRAYGNAIVPQVAAEFVRAFMETEVVSH